MCLELWRERRVGGGEERGEKLMMLKIVSQNACPN